MRFRINSGTTQIGLTVLLAIAIFFGSSLTPFQPVAEAWKPRTHVYLAEIAMLDAIKDGKVTIYRTDYSRSAARFR